MTEQQPTAPRQPSPAGQPPPLVEEPPPPAEPPPIERAAAEAPRPGAGRQAERPADDGIESAPYVTDRWLRVRAQVERNRRGGHRVPTWVLALVLTVMVGAIVVMAVLAHR